MQDSGSSANRTALAPKTPYFAGAVPVLLFGAALLIGGVQNADADTVVFTFTDDDAKSRITASGSFDLSDWGRAGSGSNSFASKIIFRDSDDPSFLIPGGGFGDNRNFATYSGEYSVYGFSSVREDFEASVSGRSYSSDIIFAIVLGETAWIRLDRRYIDNNVFDPSPANITFDGTLLEVLGDNDFHIEIRESSYKIIFTTVQAAPAKLEGLRANPGDGQVTLSWTDPGNSSISLYEVQYKSGSGDYGAWAPIGGSDASTTSHTVDGLTNATEYAFRIRAVNHVGESPESDAITGTPGAPVAAELSAEEGAQRAILSWTHAGDSSITRWQYQQREGDAAFGEWENIPASSAATRRHTVRGLTGGAGYGFRVRAVNEVGFGAPSNVASTVPPQLSLERERQVVQGSLAAMGQATLAGVTGIIDGRLQSTPGTSSLMLGGQHVSSKATIMESEAGPETGSWWLGARVPESYHRPVGNAEMLDGSAFTLSLSEEDGSDRGWTIWGRGDLQRFEGKSGEDGWDGTVKSAVLGFDTQTNESLLAGLAVSSSRGKTDLVTDEVGSRVETSLTAAWPYMQMTMPGGTGTVRVVLGIGSGDAEHHSEDGDVERTGLSMTAASVGARLAVAQQGQVTLSVPVKAEVVQLKTDGEATTAIGGLSIKSWRASGGLEAAHSGLSLDSSWILMPRGSVSFRWDGGDGVTGKGIEIGGGFGLQAPDSRLSLNVSGRWLATHSDSNQKEWGASVGVQIAPDSQGRGWSASLRQEWGLQQESALSDDTLFESGTGGSASALGSLAARAGYGFGMMEGLMTVSADARLATGDEEVPHYGAGLEFALPGGLSASLRGEHIDAVDPDTRIGAGLNLRF